ncbi:MAG: hypothetical protein GY810_15080 [Aureispira sp.]|nr:hypothetical protein [Aureispira sp.]
MKKQYKAIIPFSGGVDSTAVLYQTLTQNPEQEYFVFKVNIINAASASRTIQEEEAVRNILEWLRNHGINNFTFRKLEYNYAELGAPQPHWDSEVVNFAAASCILSHPEIEEFMEGAIADDFLQEGFHDRISHIAKILYLVTKKNPQDLKIVFPLKDMYKYDVMKSMPIDLLALTWSCRYPKGGSNYNLIRCHQCPPCQTIDKVLLKHSTDFLKLLEW